MEEPNLRMMPFVVLFLAALPAAGRAKPPEICAEAWQANHWCEAGQVGYIAGVEIRSKFLFEVLDAHGHDIEPSAVTCEVCRKAIENDGYCPAHRMGYVGGKAYLSSLTYHVAKGRAVKPASISCGTCRKNSQGIGWCEKHRVGMAGPVAIEDRRAFEEFEDAYRILLKAVEVSARCETCAGAIVNDGYCPTHRIHYKNGEAVSPR